MIGANVKKLTDAAENKIKIMDNSVFRYFILSMLAGIYVGFGVMLVFSIGAPLSSLGSGITKAVMGASFGVALTLVIFAGSELFTGNNMVMVIGSLNKKVTWIKTLKLWIICYAGNLFGSLLFALLIVYSGLIKNNVLIHTISNAKISAPFWELFIRGILCNILVCLAIWTSIAVKNEVAKLILIFWTLFAFIGSGFEHSVANMSLLAMDIFQNGISNWPGYFSNLIPVTLGNIVGGGFFVGAVYWFISTKRREKNNEYKI